jgi:hypothetical protein
LWEQARAAGVSDRTLYRAREPLQVRIIRRFYDRRPVNYWLLPHQELPDGRLKLIDGHLRRDLDPDMEVDVEVLDVTDDEARTLLLSIDPLAELAEQQEQLRERLLELAPPAPRELEEAWQAAAEACLEPPKGKRWGGEALEEQWYVLVECRDEKQQVELLTRFKAEGLTCKAVLA